MAVYPIDEILRKGSVLADEVEVYISEGLSVSADLKRTKVSRAVESQYFGLSIRTIKEGKIGTSSSSNPQGWEKCLNASLASGSLATPQPWQGLPYPAGLDSRPIAYDPSLTPDNDIIVNLLKGMIDGASSYPVEVTSGGASLSVQTVTLANSNGVYYSRPQSHVTASIETIRGNSTGYEFGNSYTLDLDPISIGERAGFLASASFGGVDISSGPYDVVLSPVAFAQLVGAVLIPSLSGRNVHAGRSRLGSSLGLRVIDPALSVYDDPFLEKGLSSTRWDAEGVPTRNLSLIREGILENFSYDLKTAYRYGKESTGSAVRTGHGGGPAIGNHNVVVDGPRKDIMEDEAIYIQDVVGAHTANPLSGDFSVELTNPFRISGGNYEKPVRKAMMSGNVFEMLGITAGLGKDDRVIGSLVVPSIRLKKQHIIGS
ncbi:MAG: TldD/PmbA family protein [Methanoregulaceae archaeon]|nr:TldD/PmbA family protein [Methanoregulaceae archaeon]